jgi:hypothetical protein
VRGRKIKGRDNHPTATGIRRRLAAVFGTWTSGYGGPLVITTRGLAIASLVLSLIWLARVLLAAMRHSRKRLLGAVRWVPDSWELHHSVLSWPAG